MLVLERINCLIHSGRGFGRTRNRDYMAGWRYLAYVRLLDGNCYRPRYIRWLAKYLITQGS